MRTRLSLLTVFPLALGFTSAQAAPPLSDPAYYCIGEARVAETGDPAPFNTINLPLPAPTPASGAGIGGVTTDVGDANVIVTDIINLGKQIWNVIAANKPVVNVQTDSANALPSGITAWDSLSLWQAPLTRQFTVTYKNLYGMTVVDFTFRILYTPGGTVGGRGRYLANVTIVPASLNVAWGYTFNADTTASGVTNAGTSQDPVAALTLGLRWSVDSVFDHQERTDDFYVKGDGSFLTLGGS